MVPFCVRPEELCFITSRAAVMCSLGSGSREPSCIEEPLLVNVIVKVYNKHIAWDW